MTKRERLMENMIKHRQREMLTSPNLGYNRMELWIAKVQKMKEKLESRKVKKEN
jgi:hypothetical protein